MKLSVVDIESLNHWDAYSNVKKDMFLATDTKLVPWTVVRFDDKKRARLNCMRYALKKLPYPDKSQAILSELGPKIIGPKEDMYEGDDW